MSKNLLMYFIQYLVDKYEHFANLVQFNEFIMNNLILIMDTEIKIYKIFVKLSFPYEL